MNSRSPLLLRNVPAFMLLVAFALILIIVTLFIVAISPTAEALEIEAEPTELTRGISTTVNITFSSDHDDDVRAEIYLGRPEFGGELLLIENLTLEENEDETISLDYSPFLGQNDLFIHTYTTFSGDDVTRITFAGIEDYSDVLLIINNNSDISKEIGNHFLSYFDPHVLYVDSPAKETISRSEFDDVRSQIEDFLEGNSLSDRINYLVTTKGVPLRVSGDGKAAFDSELTLILGQYASDIGGGGYRSNPWHNSSVRFSHDDEDIYLVTRLTGYTVEEAKAIIDKAVSAYTVQGSRDLSEGLAVMDVDPGRDGGSYTMGNDWIRAAGTILDGKGYDVLLDKTTTFVRHQENVSMYASWGSNDGHDFIGHGTNAGMESDGNGDDEPDNWEFSPGSGGDMTRTGEDKRGGSWSVRVDRDESTGESLLLQRFTPEEGYRYYVRGYVNTTAITGSGGVRLVVRHYDADDALILETLGSIRRGTTSAWTALGNCHVEPVDGLAYVQFGAMAFDCEGSAYLDDIQLVEVVPNNSYLDGSLAETIVSTGGRSFTYPTNYGQSLIADVIRSGVTGVKGYCYEPYLDAIAHPNILYDRYTAGWNLAESYYTASIKLSWMDVVVGVPKLAPFALLPDLVLSEQTITQDPGNSYNFTVDLDVANLGGSDPGGWNITFSFTNGTAYWNTTFTGDILHPMESATFQLNWTAPEPGSYTLNTFIAHSGHQTDRSNDVHSTPITVLSPPDIVPWDISLAPIVPHENTSYEIILTLKNEGETSAQDVDLSLYINDSFVETIVVDANGLENSFATFLSTQPFLLPSGFHDVRIVSDPGDAIRESNESNNEYVTSILINALPITVITGDLTTRVGEPIALDGSESYDTDGSIEQFVWRVDGRTRVGSTLEHTFDDRGTYWVNLTVRDNDDGESIGSVLVTVENTPPVPMFDLPDPPLLSFDNHTFDARPSYDNDSNPLTYHWDFGDGTNATGAIKRKSYLAPGHYSISLTVTDDMNASATMIQEISIGNRPPKIDLEIHYDDMIYNPVTLTGVEFLSHSRISFFLNGTHDPDGFLTNCTAIFGDGIVSILSLPNGSNATDPIEIPFYHHTYARSGSFNFSIIFQDNSGGISSGNVTLTFVNQPPLSSFSITPGEPHSHTRVELRSTSTDNGDILQYQWEIEGVELSGLSVNHTFTSYGYYSIVHTVTDDEGETDSWEERIFVMDIPADIKAKDITTTEGEEVRITWNATDRDGAISHYLVSFEDGTELNLTKQFTDHIFPQPGVYKVNITVVDDFGLANSTVITVYVNQIPDSEGGLIGVPHPFIAIISAAGLIILADRRRRRN